MKQDDLFPLEAMIERARARLHHLIEMRAEELSAPVRALIEFARRSAGQRTRIDRLRASSRIAQVTERLCDRRDDECARLQQRIAASGDLHTTENDA
jgi:hypothetical protein